MSAFRTLARNVLSNWAGYLVNAIIAFKLTPFVEQKLGSSSWGLWGLLIACTGYYGLLDLGIRSAVAQYVTRYLAKGDLDGIRHTVNTALGLLIGIAAILVPITIGVAFVVPYVFTIDGVDDDTAQLLFAVVGSGIALNLPLTIFQTASYARQRFDIANGVGIVQRVGAAALTVWALDAGYGLIALSVIHLGSNLAANLAHVWISYRLLPELKLSARYWQRSSVREIFGFSVWTMLINAADQVEVHASALIIPMLMSTTALAHFNMGAILVPYALQLVNSIAWTLTPQATTLDARGEREGLQRLLLDGTRAIATFAAIMVGGMMLLGPNLLELWVDPKYSSGTDYVSSGTILVVLAIGLMLRATATSAKQICFGLREVRFLARVTCLEVIVNLTLTAVLVWHYGILGAAIANVIAALVTQFWMLPAFLVRRIGYPLSRLPRALIAAVAVLAMMPLLFEFGVETIPGTTWGGFMLRTVALGFPALLVAFAIGTTAAEKQRLLRRFRRSA